MLYTLNKKFKNYISHKSDLSSNIIKNIINLLLIRVGSIAIGFILVPLTINYISPTEYGFWLTISSMVSWLSFFDIGLGNGMRNKVSESYTNQNFIEARTYISTTYAILGLISLMIVLISIIIIQYVDFRILFNVMTIDDSTVKISIIIVIISFCLQFIFNVLNSVLLAVHKSGMSGFVTFVGQFFVLLSIFIIKELYESDLVLAISILTFVPLIVLMTFSVILFNSSLKLLKPSFKLVDFSYFKKIFGLGSAFFIIQIGALILFQTDNFIISKILGPEAVTEFNIAYKLFSLITMVNFIIMTPYWNAYTHAWIKKDFKWMKDNLKIIRLLWIGLSMAAVILYFLSDIIYDLWIGSTVKISGSVTFAMLIYAIVITFQASHNYIINGIGKIKLQMYIMILSALFNIPLSFYLGNLFGIQGVIYSNVIFMLILGISFYFQTNKLIKAK